MNRLNTRAIAATTAPGLYADGSGLNLQISKTGARSWIYRYRRGDGREVWLGLGSLADVTLARAREKASEARRLRADGIDPLDVKRAPASSPQVRPSVPTFGEFADAYTEGIEAGFSNAKHRYQWRATLGEAYCASIRGKPIDEVCTEDVVSILGPIWLTKSETASRLRGRIERVLDAAKAKKLRTGENPALWRGHLDKLLPRRRKLTRGHLKAMPYSGVPAFMAKLKQLDGMSALALRFAILTAGRGGEVRGATWSEIDLDSEGKELWTVPAERMKARREHRVPLSEAARDVLAAVASLRPSGDFGRALVFPGARQGKPLSIMALMMLLRRLNAGVTAHGFRSAFRDWVGEETSFPREIAEQALAHVVGNEVERAYRRGDALEKRRHMMELWATFCTGENSVENELR